MNERLKISFDGPQHGWLTLSLKAGERVEEFAVEHVPFDLIAELTDGLHNLMQGYPSAVARGNDGPIRYQLVFDQSEEHTQLRVFVIYETLAGDDREEFFAFSDTTYNIVRPFWKALRDVETNQSLDDYRDRWRETFPVREMELLTQSVKEMKHERS